MGVDASGARPDGGLDDAVDLPAAGLTAEEEHLAVALRSALGGPPAPGPGDVAGPPGQAVDEQRVRLLVSTAVSSATRRRRTRWARVPALVLASAAACTGVVLTAGGVLPPTPTTRSGGQLGASGPAHGPEQLLTGPQLSDAEVRQVLPGAQRSLRGGKYEPDTPVSPLADACGSAALAGTAVPVQLARTSWETAPTTTAGVYRGETWTATTSAPAGLSAVVARYDDAQQADAYARALDASVASCAGRFGQDAGGAPASGPSATPTREETVAGVVLRHGHQDGRWDVLAVAVRGAVVVRLDVTVPAAGGEDDGDEQRVLAAVADLADAAARRAVGS